MTDTSVNNFLETNYTMTQGRSYIAEYSQLFSTRLEAPAAGWERDDDDDVLGQERRIRGRNVRRRVSPTLCRRGYAPRRVRPVLTPLLPGLVDE